MACMHHKTFDIYHNDQCLVPDGYIEVDELIAPSIQLLNRKGYITEWCCSGHPLSDELVRGKNPFDERLTREHGEYGYWELNDQSPRSYISFKEGISLPALPPEFVKDSFGPVSDKLVIRKLYANNGFFENARNILETMEQLYQWALNLPDFAA